MSTTQKTITQAVNGGLLDYSMYVLESRAIPSVVDGLKPVTRKLLYAMLNEHSGNRVKVSDLGGISRHNFHHGEQSAIDAAIGMAAKWSNNNPLFEQHGNFGSRLVQEAAGPRYIHASLSENFKKFFVDTEVAPTAFDPENPEPCYYLPIIPYVLINGIGGVATGFKTEILPRALKDVFDATKAYLKNPTKFLSSNAAIKPTFPDFKGNVIRHSENQWKSQGVIEYIGKNYFQISELPIGYDRASYVTLLNELIDKDLIKDYDDCCSKDGFGFKVKVSLNQKDVIDKDPYKYFKLEKIHTEILTTMGIDGKLKIFQSVAELIAYFCDFRLKMFRTKIEYDRAKIKQEIQYLKYKRQFISRVVAGNINFKTTTKQQLLDYIAGIWNDDRAKSFIRIPLYECTPDEVANLVKEILKAEAFLLDLDSLTEEKLFNTRLNSIKL